MLRLVHRGVAPATLADVQTVTSPAELLGLRALVDATSVAEPIVGFVVALVRRTRELPSVALGASPRAAVHLLAAAKAAARLAGRDFVIPDDVVAVAPAVLRHRITLRPEAELERYRADDAVAAAISSVPVPAMTPTPRAAYALLAVALLALVVPAAVAIALVCVIVVATTVDGRDRAPPGTGPAHRAPHARRAVCPSACSSRPTRRAGTVELRQAQPADVAIEPSVGRDALDAQLVAHRRGEVVLAPVAARHRGPLGLGRCTFNGEGTAPLLVYPDVVAAQRVVVALRRGQFRDPGLRARGPLGLGTDFESIRDYQPDDDVRQINWTATDRTGRPMSNVYRIEQDRDVVCLLDAGRLMTAPLDRAHDPARRRRGRGHDGRARRRRARRPLRRDRVRRRAPGPARAPPQRRPRRRAHDPRNRTHRGRQRLRPRVPHRQRRQALAHLSCSPIWSTRPPPARSSTRSPC